jgi:hypothetical protein
LNPIGAYPNVAFSTLAASPSPALQTTKLADNRREISKLSKSLKSTRLGARIAAMKSGVKEESLVLFQEY